MSAISSVSAATLTLPDTCMVKVKLFTLNLALGAGTYDMASVNAIGGIVIQDINVYVLAAGSLLTSISIQTNDSTPVVILSAAEGALANLTVGKNVTKVFVGPSYLHTSKKIQYSIIGLTGSGFLLVAVRYQSTVSGADIS